MKSAVNFCEALPAFTLLVYLFLSEAPAVWLLFFGALALHEWGHIVAFRLVRRETPILCLSGVGTRLSSPLPLLPWEEAVTALAGPLVNILFALLALRFGQGGFFLLFAVTHLIFAVGNLLPFGASDGERLLSLLLYRLFPRRASLLISLISTLSLALFFYFSLFLYYLTGNGLSGVVFALFFLFSSSEEKMRKNS